MIVDKMIELDGKPNQIIVTNNFGFVVVSMLKISENQTINKLSVFRINGGKIRSIVLTENKNIVDMISVSSVPGGFDFIFMADNLNNIYVFETFYLNIDRPLYFKKCSYSIMKLEYIKCLSLLIAFDNEKLATFYYLPNKQLFFFLAVFKKNITMLYLLVIKIFFYECDIFILFLR